MSKDRGDEALDVLAYYHAEGNTESGFVLGEFHQIQETIRLELEGSRRSWKEMLATPANRHRSFIAAMVGLFQQWSGNGLVS